MEMNEAILEEIVYLSDKTNKNVMLQFLSNLNFACEGVEDIMKKLPQKHMNKKRKMCLMSYQTMRCPWSYIRRSP